MRSAADPNLYIRRTGKSIVLILLYVDDLFVTGSHPEEITEVKEMLKKQYEMKDLGRIQKYLGIEFVLSKEGIIMHQSTYADQIICGAGLSNSKPAYTPLPPGIELITDMGSPPTDPTEYGHYVGQLKFLSQTRLDIAQAVSLVSRFMHAPQSMHLEAVKHLLRYVNTTSNFGIHYYRNGPRQLTGYTDSDWATSKDGRRSVGGYLFQFAGGPITWQSKRQPTVSRSSTEAEYKALSDGAQEAVYLRRLLDELQVTTTTIVPVSCKEKEVTDSLPMTKTILHCDNQGAIKLAKNPVFHARTKHIEVHYHFVRERVLGGEISVQYLPTECQPADLLTKSLGQSLFEKHRDFIGIFPIGTFLPLEQRQLKVLDLKKSKKKSQTLEQYTQQAQE